MINKTITATTNTYEIEALKTEIYYANRNYQEALANFKESPEGANKESYRQSAQGYAERLYGLRMATTLLGYKVSIDTAGDVEIETR